MISGRHANRISPKRTDSSFSFASFARYNVSYSIAIVIVGSQIRSGKRRTFYLLSYRGSGWSGEGARAHVTHVAESGAKRNRSRSCSGNNNNKINNTNNVDSHAGDVAIVPCMIFKRW